MCSRGLHDCTAVSSSIYQWKKFSEANICNLNTLSFWIFLQLVIGCKDRMSMLSISTITCPNMTLKYCLLLDLAQA